MNFSHHTFKRPGRTYGNWIHVALLSAAVAAPCAISSSPAQAATPIPVRELWPGQRELMVLPLGLGEGWNLTPTVSAAVLPGAERRLHNVLRETGKFSVIEAHQFNPILMRAVQERRITQEQLDALVNDTSLGNARIVLSKMGFGQPPFIADFRLEEVRPGGTKLKPTVQVQVSARLYELGGQTASNTVVVTSKSVSGGEGDVDRVLMASANAFAQAIAQLLTPPDDTITLPRAEAPAATPVKPASAVAPVPPAPVVRPVPPVVRPTPGVVLPGDVPIEGASSRGGSSLPQLPAPTPPLGISVPDSPSVDP